MLIRFFKSGTGAGTDPVEYLVATSVLAYDENRDALLDADGKRAMVERKPRPELVSGDPEKTLHLIDSSVHKWTYTSGVIAFEYDDVPTETQQLEVIRHFEDLAFAGLKNHQFDCLWVRHTHEHRVELHFCSPRLELTTGRSLNIAPPNSAAKFDACADYFNRKYGWADPKDPKRAQTVKNVRERPERAKSREELHEQLFDLIGDGLVFDRTSLVAALNEMGWETPRLGKNYITALNPNDGQRFRLKGEIFDETWTIEAQLERAVEAEGGPGRRPSSRLAGYSIDELFRRYRKACSDREKYNRGRYRPARPRDGAKVSGGPDTQRSVDAEDITGQRNNRKSASRLDQKRSSDDPDSDVGRRGLQRGVGAIDRVNLLLADTNGDRPNSELNEDKHRNSHGPWGAGAGRASPTGQRSRSMPAALTVRERLREITQGEPIDADAARERIARLRRRTDKHLRTVSDRIKAIGEVTERMRKSLVGDQQEHVDGLGSLRAGFGAFATRFTDLLERLVERARSADASQSSIVGQQGGIEQKVERAEQIRQPTRPSLKP